MNVNMTAFLIAIASGIALAFIFWFSKAARSWWREKKTYSWLKANTQDKAGMDFKTTTEIVQALGILEDQVTEACTKSKRIFECRDKKDSWGIYGDTARSIYEDHGIERLWS